MVEFSFGQTGEQQFDSTIFFGIEGTDDDRFDLSQLTAADVAELNELLFDGDSTPLFQSRSVFNLDSASDFDGVAGGASGTLVSQPIGNALDIGGNSLAGVVSTASFTREFLTANPEFQNVQLLFNDANINIFENSSTPEGLVDLNVAAADFEGIARIGDPQTITVELPEFQVPERVEITQPVTVDIVETVVATEDPLFVQTVQDKFFFVVYFCLLYTSPSPRDRG